MGKNKLLSRFRLANRLLKIYQHEGSTGFWLRGVLYEDKWDTSVSPNKHSLVLTSAANFYAKDNEATEHRVREYFGMTFARPVTSDGYIDVNHRIIWTNDNYDEWEACMLIDYPNEESREEEGITIDYETYHEECGNSLYDERGNLNVPVDGIIVCFARLGLWDGTHIGAKCIGTNVRQILYSDCDYLDWYCDRYNVRCDATHHDGSNSYLYRVAKDREEARRLINKIADGEMTEEQFRKATKSLRPYVAKVYGW
jgi:hypothetical protein